MRRHQLVLPAAALGALLLAACGTQHAGARPPAAVPDPSGAGSCDAAGSAAPSPETQSSEDDGVRLVGGAACPAFEVTNTTGHTATFTITYDLMTESGEALTSGHETVPSLRPGGTVRRPVVNSEEDGATHVRILTVRSVPTAEAPSSAGPCPPSGVRVYADRGDAAMGLRVVGVHLQNCGTHDYRLDGYPQTQVLDAKHAAVGSVRIVHGADPLANGTGADATPRPLVLRPGEGAFAELAWRNTTLAGSDPVNAPYVRVVPRPGAAAVMVTPELDLGTTGKLAVGAWQSDGTSRS